MIRTTDPAQHLKMAGQGQDCLDRDPYYTDPVQHLIMSGQGLDLDRDLYYTGPTQHLL